MMQFGAHVDQQNLVAEAQARGADIVQISIGDPKSWRKPVVDHPGGAAGLREEAEAAGIGIYVHSAFVINVASTNNRIRIPSRKLLQQTVTEAAALGARGVIVHGGHVTGDDDPTVGHDNWRKAVEGLDLEIPILIENTAGGKKAMARHLDAIERTWEAVSATPNADSVGFCLDTCHSHAAGLDMDSLVADILGITGRIDLVHLNDSRDGAGSGADRHAPIGQGQIDTGLLLRVVQEAGADVILETPCEATGHADEISWLRESLAG